MRGRGKNVLLKTEHSSDAAKQKISVRRLFRRKAQHTPPLFFNCNLANGVSIPRYIAAMDTAIYLKNQLRSDDCEIDDVTRDHVLTASGKAQLSEFSQDCPCRPFGGRRSASETSSAV